MRTLLRLDVRAEAGLGVIRALSRLVAPVTFGLMTYLLPEPVGLGLLVLVGLWVLYSLLRLPLFPKACQFCGGRPTLMMPKDRSKLRWWQLGPTRRDVTWVCAEDMPTFVRLKIHCAGGS